MKASIMLIRHTQAGVEETEMESFDIDNIGHIPRIGEMIDYGGRDYTVFEVTWSFSEDVVCIGAQY